MTKCPVYRHMMRSHAWTLEPPGSFLLLLIYRHHLLSSYRVSRSVDLFSALHAAPIDASMSPFFASTEHGLKGDGFMLISMHRQFHYAATASGAGPMMPDILFR